jgi:CelD/BcsL family acetyltransferase involved in cellulose biosynthesis
MNGRNPDAVNFRLELHRELPSTICRQWNALVQSMEQPEVSYTWEWAAATVRSFCETRPLFFLLFRADELAGAVAMDEGEAITFLTARTADYCDFISAPKDRTNFIELVCNEMRRLKLGSLKLSNISANSLTAKILKTQPCGYAQFSRPAYSCSQVLLETAEQRARAMAAAHNSRKRTARLSRLGQITIEHHTDWPGFAKEFPHFVNAHIARFNAQGKSSSLEHPDRQRFLQQLGGLLSNQGSLRCSVLRVGGKAVAWHFGMMFRGKWFWYQPAFDLAYDSASPGTYLLREVIREAALSSEFRAVDLGLGDESYKGQYANSANRTLHFTLELSKFQLAREKSRYYAAQLMKRSPRVERLARRAISACRPDKMKQHRFDRRPAIQG